MLHFDAVWPINFQYHSLAVIKFSTFCYAIAIMLQVYE